MKTIKVSLYIIIALLSIIILFTWYIGYFRHIAVSEKTEGGYTLVGLEFSGPYSEAGKNIMNVNDKLEKIGINSVKGFGIYYDAPNSIPSEKYRSFVGNILEEKDYKRIAELKSAGFKVDSVPYTNSIVTEFPLKNFLSYMVGPMKVYPVISEYTNAKGCKTSFALEIYDTPNKKIVYIMPCTS